MKNKIILVCCDIEGTISYTGVTDNVLINNLMYIDTIRKKDHAEKAILSFISSSDRKSILENYKKFINLISFCNANYNTNIMLGPQFSSSHCYNPNNNQITKTKPDKFQQISELLHNLEDNIINEVIVIDDHLFQIPALLLQNKNLEEKIKNNELVLTFISSSRFIVPRNYSASNAIKTYIENCSNFMGEGLKKRLLLKK